MRHSGYSKNEVSVSIPLRCQLVKAETVYYTLRGILPSSRDACELFENQIGDNCGSFSGLNFLEKFKDSNIVIPD